MELIEDSDGALVFLYRPWSTATSKRMIPVGIPIAAFLFILAAFGVFPYPWLFMAFTFWLFMVLVLVTGDMHRDFYWRFDRQTNEAILYSRRAPHLKNIHVPVLWSKTGEVRRIKFDDIQEVLLEDRRIAGYPEYRIMMILDGPADDDKNRQPLIWAFSPDKHVIDWAEKVKATVYGGSPLLKV